MGRGLLLAGLALLALPVLPAPAQTPPPQPTASQSPFLLEEAMIPMRDGVKLHTVILRPRDQTGPLPILFSRTPYGAPAQAPPRSPRTGRRLRPTATSS